MSKTTTALILEPNTINGLRSEKNVLIVDLCQAETYIKNHVPNAVYLDYNWIVTSSKPCMGLLPDIEQLAQILTAYGIDENTHVIAYDDEGGGRACRFLWTLQCVGQQKLSLINGGLHAWSAEGIDMEQQIHFPTPLKQKREISYDDTRIANKNFILEHLEDAFYHF